MTESDPPDSSDDEPEPDDKPEPDGDKSGPDEPAVPRNPSKSDIPVSRFHLGSRFIAPFVRPFLSVIGEGLGRTEQRKRPRLLDDLAELLANRLGVGATSVLIEEYRQHLADRPDWNATEFGILRRKIERAIAAFTDEAQRARHAMGFICARRDFEFLTKSMISEIIEREERRRKRRPPASPE